MYKFNRILVVADGYPTDDDPFFPFVEQVVNEFSKLGISVTVVAPQSFTRHLFRKKPLHPKYRISSDRTIEIYQPYFVSFGRFLSRLNHFFWRKALSSVLCTLEYKPQICYGHFWTPTRQLYNYAKSNNLPLFVATGESKIPYLNSFSKKQNIEFFKYISGVICVSTKNKRESINLGFTTRERCIVLPNGVNINLFKKRSKSELRKKYGFNDEDFIVAFVGYFCHRKGSKRLSNSISELNDKKIKSFFIGNNMKNKDFEPNCPGILFKGRLQHDILVDYLNMSDVFCLPTLAEGCCNAIVEALACGLPVISSDLDFNLDILDDSNSILINPLDEGQISSAIKLLKQDNNLRNRLSEGALLKAGNLSVQVRAKKILDFINNKI